MSNYEGMTVPDLRNLAKERGMKGYSRLRRQELIDFLNGELVAAPGKPAAKPSPPKPATPATPTKPTVIKINETETLTYVEPGKTIGLSDHGKWLLSKLPVAELAKCGIKLGLIAALDDESPNINGNESEVLILPSGEIIEVQGDPEGNHPGSLQPGGRLTKQ